MAKFSVVGDFVKTDILGRSLSLRENIQAWFIGVAIVFASGCSTTARFSPAHSDYKTEECKKEGLVIVSFEQVSRPYRFYYRPLPPNTGPVQNVKVCNTLNGATLWDAFKTDCCRNGIIFYDNKMMVALQLPEGDYEFYYWQENCGISGKTFPEYYFSCPFKSISGKAVYAGSFIRSKSKYPAGLNGDENSTRDKGYLKGSYDFGVTDNRERDIPMFLKYFCNIRKDRLEIHIMRIQQTTEKVLKTVYY